MTHRWPSLSFSSLGHGWMHSYGIFLEPGTASINYVSEDLHEIAFTPSGTNAWTSPPQWHEKLTKDTSGYHLRFKTGLVYDFDLAGKLLRQVDPNGNAITLSYESSGRLQSATGSGGNSFTFGYDGSGKLASVTDSAGRVVTYLHEGDDFTEVDDVLGKAQKYGYDGAHNITSTTDKNGNTTLELYDADDRWLGSVDPLGGTYSIAYDDLHDKAAVTDKNGNTTIWEWNAAGNPVSVTDALGNTTTKSWDAAMNLLSKTDGSGSTWAYSQYDANGNAHRVSDPLSNADTYNYDLSFNRMTSHFQPGLGTSNFVYDTKGNLTQATNANREVTTYTYEPNGLPKTITQVGNASTPDATTTLGYDSAGNLRTLTDPTDAGTTLGYDSAGHLTSIQDALGDTRTIQVDARGRQQSITDGENHTTTYGYDDQGNRTSTTDAENRTSTLGHDALNRITSTTDALGHTSRTEYDAMGNVIARIDANGNRTTYKYDALNRQIEVDGPDGSVTSLGYCSDRAAQPCTTVDPLGNVTAVTEDELGRPGDTTDALGNTTTQHYDAAGRVDRTTDANRNTALYTFDGAGRVKNVSQPGTSVQYTYDPRGNRLTVVNYQNTQTTTYTYDLANHLLSETTPPAYNGVPVTTSYSYDGAGDRQTKTDGMGQVTHYTYDHNRRLTRVDFQDGSHYDYAYDTRGNRTLERHVDATGAVVHERDLTFNELNRLSLDTDVTLERDISYGYDANGNRASMTVTVHATGAIEASFTYRYDSKNRLIEVTDQDGDITRLTYDLAGNRTSLTYGNGMVARYGYDADNRLISIVYTRPDGSVLQSFTYTLDPDGNRVSKVFADDSYENYKYDTLSRLTEVDKSDGNSTTYALNGFGQITSVGTRAASGASTTTFNTVNTFNQITKQVTGSVTTNYSYDGNGNLTVSAPSNGGSTVYKYDLDNRMVEVDLPGALIDTYEYDANGLRTEKRDSTGTTHYLLDGLSVVSEYDGTNSLTEKHNNNPQRVDEQFDLVQGGTKLWPVCDGLESAYAWVDRGGNVVGSYSYDVYGARTQTSGSANVAWGYTGREHDADTGTIYLRDRGYVPGLATFTQPDRYGLVNGPNIYRYAVGNPVSRADPYGLWATNSVEAYAMYHWAAYVMLLVDLGAVTAGPIAQLMDDTRGPTNTCPLKEKDPVRQPITYYRGASVADVKEYYYEGGIISSKMRRAGLDLVDGILAYEDPSTARAHVYTSRNSPFVSVTLSLNVAVRFAKGRDVSPVDPDDAPSGVVFEFATVRPPARPGKEADQEYLFFWLLGLPHEQLTPVLQVTKD